MKLTKEHLYKLIQEVVGPTVQEIELRGSLGAKHQVDVDWAAGKAEQITKEKIDFGDRGIKILSAPSSDHTKIIAYIDENPVGYMSLVPFMDGMKVSTVSVKPEAQGKGVASTIYKYVISQHNLYSGDSQTPESKSLWQNYLAKKFDVVAIDVNTKQEVEPSEDVVYTKLGDPPNNVYLLIRKTLSKQQARLANLAEFLTSDDLGTVEHGVFLADTTGYDIELRRAGSGFKRKEYDIFTPNEELYNAVTSLGKHVSAGPVDPENRLFVITIEVES